MGLRTIKPFLAIFVSELSRHNAAAIDTGPQWPIMGNVGPTDRLDPGGSKRMILPGEEDLAAIIANGSMRALRLHAFDRGIDGTDALPALREIVKAEYPSLLTTLGNALEARMGAEMYRSIINTYCNAWAVQALGARA